MKLIKKQTNTPPSSWQRSIPFHQHIQYWKSNVCVFNSNMELLIAGLSQLHLPSRYVLDAIQKQHILIKNWWGIIYLSVSLRNGCLHFQVVGVKRLCPDLCRTLTPSKFTASAKCLHSLMLWCCPVTYVGSGFTVHVCTLIQKTFQNTGSVQIVQ